MCRGLFIITLFLFTYIVSFGQTGVVPVEAIGTIQICPDNIKWVDAPAPFMPGAKMVVLEGSPKKEGVFTVRFKLPKNYVIPPHTHGKDERVTIISGSVYVAFGDKVDKNAGKKFTTACYYVNPANSHHYVYTLDEEVILQITGIGPWSLNMIEDH